MILTCISKFVFLSNRLLDHVFPFLLFIHFQRIYRQANDLSSISLSSSQYANLIRDRQTGRRETTTTWRCVHKSVPGFYKAPLCWSLDDGRPWGDYDAAQKLVSKESERELFFFALFLQHELHIKQQQHIAVIKIIACPYIKIPAQNIRWESGLSGVYIKWNYLTVSRCVR